MSDCTRDRCPAARCVGLALLVLVVWAGGASSLLAADRVLRLDPVATHIDFFLGTPLHDVEGSFRLKSGEIRFDDEAGTASGEVVVELTGARTGNGSRDETMHQEVLESQKFPLASFRFERIEGRVPVSGRGEVKLTGSLDFHGAPHSMTVPASVTVDGERLTATAELVIPFLDWGLHDPSLFLIKVQRQVKVTIRATGQLGAGS